MVKLSKEMKMIFVMKLIQHDTGLQMTDELSRELRISNLPSITILDEEVAKILKKNIFFFILYDLRGNDKSE